MCCCNFYHVENGTVGYIFGDDNVLLKYDARIKNIPYKNNPQLPASFELLSAYPNPFNAFTTIRFQVPEPALVTLTIL
jgi:hypothetical protein